MAGELEPVSDPTLARALIEKVNKLNNDSGTIPVIASLAWSILPQETASSIGFVGLVLAILYLVEDKVPKEV